MKEDYTHITLLLDRTGSMESIKDDTIGGFNAFLADQQKEPGEASMSLIQFDSVDPYEVINDFDPIAQVKPLDTNTFVPRSTTPLLDAIGRGINDITAKLGNIPEEERPDKVIFVVLTDGHENASREFRDRSKIMEMIKDREENHMWKFVFLGANQDAIKEAGSIGISAGSTMTYASTSGGTRHAFMSMSKGMSKYRGADAVCAAGMDYFDGDDRKAQEDEGVKNGGTDAT